MVGHDPRQPVSTIVGKGSTQAVVAAHLTQFYGSASSAPGGNVAAPMATVTAEGHPHGLEAPLLVPRYGECAGQAPRARAVSSPMPTVVPTANGASLVAAFLASHQCTGVVTVDVGGEPYVIVDIGMRMLTPRELFRAQGFRDSYEIETGVEPDGSPRALTKTEQNRMCGNSVSPDMAEVLVAANYRPRAIPRRARACAPLFDGVEA